MRNADRHPEEAAALSGDEWRRLRDLFGDAQELPESERKAFLDRELAGEPTLRAELDSILASAETIGGFLAPRDSGVPASTSPAPGSMVGPYRLVELLGEGGFGIVYLAEQERPIRRRVALKLIKPGMDTRQVVARFEAERQTLAMMDHSSIAQVFDAGETDAGRPFFAMEYVPGVPITAFCDVERLRIRERLDLFLDVCDAVQHAHQKGVIHRDLKPSNVLVTRRDGAPALKVIDFGIVKATGASIDERSFVTREGLVLGTIGYMSPEQAGAIQAEVDTRSDIYSLGVMLYELLAGEAPFDRLRLQRAEWSEAVRIIREEEPPSLTARLARGETSTVERAHQEQKERSGRVTEIAQRRAADERTLLHELRGELEWITLRALEKEPGRRYASASELSADIRRHLANEPVLARAPSTLYRVRKFARRHRVAVAAASLVLLAIVTGGIAATVGFTRAVRAERTARREADSARRVSDFLVEMFRTSNPDQSRGETITARTILEEGTRKIEAGLKEDPLVRARLLSTLGEVHMNLGMRDEGFALLREGLAVAESSGTRDELEIATHLYTLARQLRSAGMQEEVRALLDRAIPIAQDAGDAGRSLLAQCFYVKAKWYNDHLQLPAADSLVALGLRIAESEAPPDTQQIAQVIALRGNIAHRQFRLQDAERDYLRALELSDKTGRSPSLSVDLNESLSSVYKSLRQPDKSMEHAERGLNLAREIYTPNHPSLAFALGGYANALSSKGDYEQAVAVREQALEIYRANSGMTLNLAMELQFASDLYRRLEQWDRAIAYAEEAYQWRVKDVGVENARAGEALLNLADCCRLAGRLERADSTYRAAIAVLDGTEPKGIACSVAHKNYANLCRDTGRLAEADTLYLHARASLDSTKAMIRAFHGENLTDHAVLRSLQARHEEAEAMVRRGYGLMTKDLAEDSHEMGPVYLRWARVRALAGNMDGAIEELALAARSRVTAKDVNRFPELIALHARADFPSELRQ